ncbi:response regulator [Alteromonas facilis]|uniref:response regulator n=1 Tax=Alteromonas facilis TaxID=2048004 RepID=UPI000C2908BA|nr:response regulator transcription factor [Alteromonas facilis]
MIEIVSLDDHPLISDGLKESLQLISNDFLVHSFSCPKETMQHLALNIKTDLLVLDISMPEIDGISFMQGMINRNLIVPTVIMSASEDIQLLRIALSKGALGIIPKSITSKEVANCIRLALLGEVVLPEKLKSRMLQVTKFAEENTGTILSDRQLEILKMVQAGLSNNGIGSVLYISELTVKSHLQTIFKILGAKNRVECVRKAENLGILMK